MGLLLLRIAVNLSYRIIFGLPGFVIFVGHLEVLWSLTLEICLGVDITVDIAFPIVVLFFSWEENFIRCCLSDLLVLSREHSHFVTFLFVIINL